MKPMLNKTVRASAAAPGTCGELAQGLLNGIHCMVTCPIDMYSLATVELSTSDVGVSGPIDCAKARQAVQATLDCLQKPAMGATLWLESPLPRGKGMASSTADVAAAMVATASALGLELSSAQIAEIVLGVEPSDGIILPGIALFDHRAGRIALTLGPSPPMRVVILDFGGDVDTGEFNRVDRDDVLKGLEPDMAHAVRNIEDGIRFGSPPALARAPPSAPLPTSRYSSIHTWKQCWNCRSK